MPTDIEWVRNEDGTKGETWNPVTGCAKVSEGCDHCYAERITNRFAGAGAFDTVVLHPDRIERPLRWRRPRTVFVNSMSDLFHEAVPVEFIEQIFVVMARASHHQFQVLTKRPGRMASVLNQPGTRNFIVNRAASEDIRHGVLSSHHLPEWPLPNVWLGTSVENQKWANVRIPKLLGTPAAVRFLSCEPLLGPIDLTAIRSGGHRLDVLAGGVWDPDGTHHTGSVVDWVIVGGESGPGARPMDLAWAGSLRDQCVDVRVPFFFKQWGGLTAKAGGRELDGRTWDQMPDTRELSASLG